MIDFMIKTFVTNWHHKIFAKDFSFHSDKVEYLMFFLHYLWGNISHKLYQILIPSRNMTDIW